MKSMIQTLLVGALVIVGITSPKVERDVQYPIRNYDITRALSGIIQTMGSRPLGVGGVGFAAGSSYKPVTSFETQKTNETDPCVDETFVGNGRKFEGVGDEDGDATLTNDIQVTTAQNGTTASATFTIAAGTPVNYDVGYYLRSATQSNLNLYRLLMANATFYVTSNNHRFYFHMKDFTVGAITNQFRNRTYGTKTILVSEDSDDDESDDTEDGSDDSDDSESTERKLRIRTEQVHKLKKIAHHMKLKMNRALKKALDKIEKANEDKINIDTKIDTI